jgi:hypothetical protein
MRDSEKLGGAVSLPQAFQDKEFPPQKGGYTTQSNGNGNHKEPEIIKIFEPLDDETQAVQDRWVEIDLSTGDFEVAFSDEMKNELGIELDSDSESN